MATTFPNILTDVDSLISSAASGFTRKIRRRIVMLPGDSLPLCIMVPIGWTGAEESFEGKIRIRFSIGVAMLYAGNMQLNTGLTTILDQIDAVRKALHTTSLSTATTVNDSEIDLSPLFDLSALDANVDYALMQVSYLSEESRN